MYAQCMYASRASRHRLIPPAIKASCRDLHSIMEALDTAEPDEAEQRKDPVLTSRVSAAPSAGQACSARALLALEGPRIISGPKFLPPSPTLRESCLTCRLSVGKIVISANRQTIAQNAHSGGSPIITSGSG